MNSNLTYMNRVNNGIKQYSGIIKQYASLRVPVFVNYVAHIIVGRRV